MRILGHRGASADFPENTLDAFTAAVEQGADGVELDVMRCASGELVVCHDEELSRVAHRPWVVAKTPWWKLRTADVGTPLGFAPARIPLLDEVFDALPSGFFVNVELKCLTVEDGGLSDEVGALIERRDLRSRALVSSFNPLCLIRMAVRYPQISRGLLVDPDRSWLPQIVWLPFTAQTSIHPHFAAVSATRVSRWHSLGLKVASWTVDDPAQAQRLEAMGVDFVITNRPGELRRKLSRQFV